MLRKLFKYDWKYSMRILPFSWLAVVGLAGLTRLMIFLAEKYTLFSVPMVLTVLMYIIVCGGTVLLPYVIAVIRFYKNMVGDEGYLTFTLPVPTWKLIFSKLIMSVISILFGFLAVALSIFCLVANNELLYGIGKAIEDLMNMMIPIGLRMQVILYIIEVLLNLFLSLSTGMMMLYAAMSIGQLFRGHRILGAVGAYFGLYFVMQFLNGIGVVLLMLIPSVNTLLFSDGSFASSVNVGNYVLALSAVLNGAYCLIYFFVTNAIMSKKLNLE